MSENTRLFSPLHEFVFPWDLNNILIKSVYRNNPGETQMYIFIQCIKPFRKINIFWETAKSKKLLIHFGGEHT